MRGDKVEIDISVFPVFLSEKASNVAPNSFAHSVPLTMISLFSFREFRRVLKMRRKNAIDAKSNGARSIDPHGTNYTRLIPNAFNRSRRVPRLLNNVSSPS